MSNEQRAHELTMFYLKMHYDSKRRALNENFEFDAISEYVELYPEILRQINIVFTD